MSIAKFTHTYSQFYGSNINNIITSLINHDDKIALINPFLESQQPSEITQAQAEMLLGFNYWRLPKDVAPKRCNNLMSHYFLDKSSLLAPLLLPLSPGMRVLDMCSAPGGKLLVMLSRRYNNLEFVANDLSSARVQRLRSVISSYVPLELHNLIKITNYDASFFALKTPGSFDAILLDAPCSSEQHVLKNPRLLAKFNGLRKSLPGRQYSLLCSALLALKPQGYVMYATCSINADENEGVIKKLIKKKGETFRIIALDSPLGTIGPYGVSVMPHLHQAGPAFLTLLQKV